MIVVKSIKILIITLTNASLTEINAVPPPKAGQILDSVAINPYLVSIVAIL